MDEGKLTILDVLQDSVTTLNNISLPVAFMDTVGLKLALVAKNLHECIVAIIQSEKKEGESDGGKADPE